MCKASTIFWTFTISGNLSVSVNLVKLKEEIWKIFEAFLLVSISRIFLKKKLSLSCIQPCFPNHKLYPRSSSKVFQSCSGIHFHFFIVAIMSWKAKGETLIPFIFVVLKRLGHMSKRNGDTNIEQVLGYKHVLEPMLRWS